MGNKPGRKGSIQYVITRGAVGIRSRVDLVGRQGEYGRVAIVEAVNSDGSFLVSDNIQGVQDRNPIFVSVYQLTTIHFATPN